ncbi:unnamed protein product [Ranitomeya imitator]|uniref:E3 ubiquitin-protein ligase n=1 Tax=Ranitomeya imitator TaxID=111125 RepID=A0ABN9KSK0_9NEOB|nr:unnamed protein product [Ranitomeya imitator]
MQALNHFQSLWQQFCTFCGSQVQYSALTLPRFSMVLFIILDSLPFVLLGLILCSVLSSHYRSGRGLHALLSKSEVAYRFPELLPFSELSPPMLIEHPLRCLVLCAQVHAGMWRRNGFSLVNQIYYYHNVKCRREMFDKDIVMLQDLVQQNNTLIEEMLHLIIMIVGERFCPGVGHVTSADEIKREIVHQLSIRPMAHSELVKALPEDENKETGMEQVIETIASFKKPGLTGRGLYELKPECTKDFNLFYYHYSRAEQSKILTLTTTQLEHPTRASVYPEHPTRASVYPEHPTRAPCTENTPRERSMYRKHPTRASVYREHPTRASVYREHPTRASMYREHPTKSVRVPRTPHKSFHVPRTPHESVPCTENTPRELPCTENTPRELPCTENTPQESFRVPEHATGAFV